MSDPRVSIARMDFPVDILANADPESLEQSAKRYMSELLYRNSESHEYLSIPGPKRVEIDLCNVGFAPLYGVNDKQKVLAVFSPEESLKAVGLYLQDQWWSAEDILKTADSSRTGLIKVRTTGERIVLYVLNRIIYRTKEITRGDVPFLCHGEDEIAKILWKNGEAVGFYSVKPKGGLCSGYFTQSYELPVMDTIFVRKCHRGNGHGLQMLKDFVNSFKQDCMGLKYPLSPAMYKVCKRYLSLYPENTEMLWEINGVGSPFPRTQIARKLQVVDLKGNPQVVEKLNFDTEDGDILMEGSITHGRETMMEFTEITEEIVCVKRKRKEEQDTHVTAQGRSDDLEPHRAEQHRCRADVEREIRLDELEPEVQCAEDDLVHEDSTLSSNSKEPEIKDIVETMTCDVMTMSEEQNKLTPKYTHQLEMEKQQVAEITPIMAIQGLKGNEDIQIIKTIEATAVSVDLQHLERQQVVEVEHIKMSSETEEVKDGREPCAEIVRSEEDDKDNVDDIIGMGQVSVVKMTVDNTDEVEVEKKEAGALVVSLLESEKRVKEKDNVEETGTVQECLCEQETEGVNAVEVVGKVSEPSEEQERERAPEMVQAEIVLSTEEATLNLQKEDSDKDSTRHTDTSRDLKETSQPETDRLNPRAEPTEKVQEMEMTQNENVTAVVMDKIENNSIEEIEEIERRVITTDVELTTDEDKMEDFQEEKEIKTIQDKVKEIKSKDIESSEDDEGVKSDEKINLTEEEEDKTNFVTQLRCSRRMKHQAAKATKSNARRSSKTAKPKTIEQQTKQDVDGHEVEQMEEVAESHAGTSVVEIIESGLNESALNVEDQEKVTSAENISETTKHDENVAVVDVPVTEDIEAAETELKGGSQEPSAAESFDEQREEPISERLPNENDNNTNETFVPVDFNNAPPVHESDNSEIGKGTSELQDKVVQELHKPESTDDRNEGEEVKQTEGEVEKEQEGEMMENKHEQTKEERDEKMEMDENIISNVDDKVPESGFTHEKKMDKTQKEGISNENVQGEKTVIQDDIQSSEDDEELKSDDQIELSKEKQHKTRCVTPLKRLSRHKHQVAKSELTKRVLRSATKASKTKAVKHHMKQSVDEPEVEQIKDVHESHTETAVKEKIVSESITTQLEHVKAVEIEVEGKTPGQSAAKSGEEQEEEPTSETVPAEDENTEEATSGLKLQEVVNLDFEKVSTTPTDAVIDDKVPSQPQEEVDLELHKPEATDTESQAKNTEEEQVVEMTEIRNSRSEKTDEKLESEEGVALNDEEMDELQKETETAQEIQTAESKSLESSEEDEGERSEDEDEEETSSVTPLRRSKRLKGQSAESEMRRRSTRLSDKATLHERCNQQIKSELLEGPEQLDVSKSDDVNNILGSEIGPGEQVREMEVFNEGDSEILIAVQSSCEDGTNLEKGKTEIDGQKNIKISHGNVGEESSEDVTQQDKMPQEHMIHGEKDAEVVTEDEDKVQDVGVEEMVHEENSENIIETASALMQQVAAVVLVDVSNVPPNLRDDCSSAFVTEEMGNKLKISQQVVGMPEELKKELQSKNVDVEDIEIESLNPPEGHPADLNTAANDTVEEDHRVVTSNVEDDTSELKKKKYSVEIIVDKESKTKQSTQQDPVLNKDSVLKVCSEAAIDMQNILDLHDTEIVKDNISVEEQEQEIATGLVLEEDKENVVESTSMVKRHKPAVVLVDCQRQAGGNGTDGNETAQSQDVALLTTANEEKAFIEMDGTKYVTERKEATAVELGTDNNFITNDDEQYRDIHAEGVKDNLEEVEDITLKEKSTCTFDQKSTHDEGISVNSSSNVRLKTLPVETTPRRTSRHLQTIHTETNVNEESSDEVVFIRHLRRRTIIVTPRKTSKHFTDTQEPEMEAHMSHEITAEARTAVEETHETRSKCDSEDSEVTRKDQQHDKNDTERYLEEVSDGGKDMVGETADREICDLPDENQEKHEPDDPNQEHVRNANSKQESVQQEELLLEEKFEDNIDQSLEEHHLEGERDAVIDHSNEHIGVENRALRKRTITVKAGSVRKSKRFCKLDQGVIDGQTLLRATTEESASEKPMVMEMTATESKTTDQGKGQESASTVDMSKQAKLSEILNVSQDTDAQLVAQEEEKGDENTEEQPVEEKAVESGTCAGKADEVADEPREHVEIQVEPEQSEKNAERNEASTTVDESFLLELDEDINSSDAECHQMSQEKEKEILDGGQESGVMTKHIRQGRKSATSARRVARRSRRLLHESQSEEKEKSEVEEEVKDVIGEEEKKLKKRKAVAELTPRRSKRLGKE